MLSLNNKKLYNIIPNFQNNSIKIKSWWNKNLLNKL